MRLSRLLLADEAGSLRDPVCAKALLEIAVKESPTMSSLRELTTLFRMVLSECPRDPQRAMNLFGLASEMPHDQDNVDTPPSHYTDVSGAEANLQSEDPSGIHPVIIELVLRTTKFKPQQCFPVVLGGAGSGKTSVDERVSAVEGKPSRSAPLRSSASVSRTDRPLRAVDTASEVLEGDRRDDNPNAPSQLCSMLEMTPLEQEVFLT